MNEVFVQFNDVMVNASLIQGADIADLDPSTPMTRIHIAGRKSPLEVEMSLYEVIKTIREAQNAIHQRLS